MAQGKLEKAKIDATVGEIEAEKEAGQAAKKAISEEAKFSSGIFLHHPILVLVLMITWFES